MEKKVSVEIEGMHCNSCAAIIEDRLSALQGVKEVKASFAGEKADITFDSDKASLEKIGGELGKLGYRLKGSPASNPLNKSRQTIKEGIIYGLVPHIGCIGFIVASVLGATIAVQFFKPLLMNPWFFHILVLISIGFATASAILYLRKNGLLSMKGAKRKKKYLATMYGSTVAINLVLFLAIFPMLANLDTGSFSEQTTGAIALAGIPNAAQGSVMRLAVNIPCPGHAPLISGELKAIDGVTGVKYEFPNLFDVAFNPEKTSKEEILSLEVFEPYPATVVSGPEQGLEVTSFSSESTQSELREVSSKSSSSSGFSCPTCGATSCTGGCGCGG